MGRLRGRFLLMTGGLLSKQILTRLFCGVLMLLFLHADYSVVIFQMK